MAPPMRTTLARVVWLVPSRNSSASVALACGTTMTLAPNRGDHRTTSCGLCPTTYT